MADYIAFLRAVNVGGRFVTMQALRVSLQDAGFADVQTHIQSGNVRLTTELDEPVAVGAQIRTVLSDLAGFDIPAILRTPSQVRTLAATVAATPPPTDLAGPTRTYVALLGSPAPADAVAALNGWAVEGERAKVVERDILIWLTVPSHSARLTNVRIERLAKAQATTRDAKVIRAIAERWC